MPPYITAVNLAYDCKDGRKFVMKRFIAVQMVVVIGFAFVLVAVLLIFGPAGEHLVASPPGPLSGAVGWIWWIAQWPILLTGLLAAFATLLYLGPDVEHPRWHFLSPGSLFATVVWLAALGALAFYTSGLASSQHTS